MEAHDSLNVTEIHLAGPIVGKYSHSKTKARHRMRQTRNVQWPAVTLPPAADALVILGGLTAPGHLAAPTQAPLSARA